MLFDACNRFYTLIPHDFGLKTPPLLNDSKIIKEKMEMLNSLLEIEIAYRILNVDSDDNADDLIDIYYKNLHCEMEVLDEQSDVYQHILTYIKNTHGITHSNYKLIVKDIIKLNREGEAKRYETKKKLTNRKLLWHGSRVTNYAGILSQGLRIAPPEAPPSGYMVR
jgi:hypothetical protein